MLTGTLNKIREERAALIRDIEYIREMCTEDEIDDRLFDLELMNLNESGNIYEEAAETAKLIPTDTTFVDEEIKRILNAKRNLSFDEMLGIEDDDE